MVLGDGGLVKVGGSLETQISADNPSQISADHAFARIHLRRSARLYPRRSALPSAFV